MKRTEKEYDDSASGFVGLPHSRTETSKGAAESMVPRSAKQRQRVWEFIHERGGYGATANEIEAGLGISGNAVRPRIIELRDVSKVCKTNATRKTPSGRAARVYVAVEFVTEEMVE
jgi:hypothetical protein